MAVIYKKDMQFDKLKNLHFASFVILEEDHEFDPCLIFEATVDGEIDDFLDAFIAVAGEGLDKIYEHCEGYPVSGRTLPHLVKRYLTDHDVGYNVFYSGHPGRTVAAILGENALRIYILKFIKKHRDRPGAWAPSLRGIQRQIQRYVVCREPEGTDQPKNTEICQSECPETEQSEYPDKPESPNFRWVEEVAAVPFAVKYGRAFVVSLGLAVLAVVAWVILTFSGISIGGLFECFWDAEALRRTCTSVFGTNWLSNLIGVVFTFPFHIFGWLANSLIPLRDWIPETTRANLVLLLLTWIAFRSLHFGFALWEDSGNAGISRVLWAAVQNAIVALQWVCFAILIGLAIMVLPKPTADARYADFAFIHGLEGALFVLGAWLFLRYLKTLPRMAGEDPHGSAVKRGLSKLLVDALQVFTLIPVWFGILVVVWWFPLLIGLRNLAAYSAGWVLLLGACAFLVVAAFFLAGLAWLLSIYVREVSWDSRKYRSAKDLTENPVGSEAFAREGHGINKMQNHLVSLSYIKGGPLRRLRLRIVLFVINLLCRWWYNRGELGGVPDIHFLRGIIIDKGRRLLFLDNYHGSWEGYLSAFIDGGAVKGLNAIWSHTYVRSKTHAGRVGFPLTACLVWKGARDERPFKEIVRTSQPETLVWYSAYPSLSGINIITNSAIRDTLFQDLDTAALDALAQRLR